MTTTNSTSYKSRQLDALIPTRALLKSLLQKQCCERTKSDHEVKRKECLMIQSEQDLLSLWTRIRISGPLIVPKVQVPSWLTSAVRHPRQTGQGSASPMLGNSPSLEALTRSRPRYPATPWESTSGPVHLLDDEPKELQTDHTHTQSTYHLGGTVHKFIMNLLCSLMSTDRLENWSILNTVYDSFSILS